MPKVLPGGLRRRPPRDDSLDLERELLRRSVDALQGGGPRCADCHRTPLVGEAVHVYARGVRVCELCRPLRAEEPERSELVRHGLTSRAVRLVGRAV